MNARLVLIFLFHITVYGVHAEPAGEGVVIPRARLEPFFAQHCISCHGPEKEKGQLRLDQLSYEVNTNDEAQKWQDILDALNGADMPPEDEPQPSEEELTEVLDLLTRNIEKARQSLTDHGGKITLRRLNRREYMNTAKELFGFELMRQQVPADSETTRFDTVGSDQEFLAYHFDEYLKLGETLASEAIRWAKQGQLEAETTVRKFAGINRSVAEKIIKNNVKSRMSSAKAYMKLPHTDTGSYLVCFAPGGQGFGDIQVIRKKVDPRAHYRVRISAGLYGSPEPIRTFIRIGDVNVGNAETYATLKVFGTPEQPEVIEFALQPVFTNNMLRFAIGENRSIPGTLKYLARTGLSGEHVASIWVDWVEVEGPVYSNPPSVFEQLYLSQKWDDGNVRELIRKFSFEAFRHSAIQENYLEALMEIFEANRKEGANFEEALSHVLGIVLASPKFLYLTESPDDVGQLSDRELAIRLAFFLWGGPPDAELYQKAERGELSGRDQLIAEVNRMLIHPRAEGFYDGFVGQWLDLDRYEEITNSLPRGYEHFNKGIQHSAGKEARKFFQLLVNENLSATNLIDSDFIVVNECLATHYGFLELGTNEFVKLVLPEESPRGGLLTQAVFLSVGSNGERTSPVIRGMLVMEMLLDEKVPDPPPNVPELDSTKTGPLSVREMTLMHQGSPQCASCHRKMDSIGFALENFDLTGLWREYEDVGKSQELIRTNGIFVTGEEFSDLNELRALMLKSKDRVAEGMIKSLLSYGLGRTMEFSDGQTIERIRVSLEASDYAMLDMIHQIVTDPVFRTKK